MYCGDETGAFVGDCGLSSCRFGYGGEDCPKLVCNSYVKKKSLPPPRLSLSSSPDDDDVSLVFGPPPHNTETTPGGDALLHDSFHLEHRTGLVSSFDAWESIWETAFRTLRVRSDEHTTTPHPVLLVEDYLTGIRGGSSSRTTTTTTHGPDRHAYSDCDTRRQRETMLQILFEKWDAPVVFIVPAPMLQAFSMGRQTALVVDMGAGGCRATPIVDGLVCKTSQRRNGRGGDWLSQVQLNILQRQQPHVQDRYTLKKKKKYKPAEASPFAPTPTNNSLSRRLSLLELMYEMKTSEHVTTPLESNSSSSNYNSSSSNKSSVSEEEDDDEEKKVYELPDGTIVNLSGSQDGELLCHLPELLFSQHPQSSPVVTTTTPSLPSLVHSAISSVDVDVRKELCGNILLCGAHSLFPCLEQRLSHEMSQLTCGIFKSRVVAPRNSVERRFASWIGGSVLTSLGSFQQLWLSKQEYEEYGGTLASQRFP